MHLNLGLSGLAFVGHDIGGFVGRPDPELFARWMELGAFVPYCRNHADSHTKVDDGEPRNQHPWTFGDEVEAISKKYLRLRYRLLPYLYNEFREATKTGKPVQQPLVVHFQDDERTHDIADQFMFGDDMMIAPVLEEGATSREVYLPRESSGSTTGPARCTTADRRSRSMPHSIIFRSSSGTTPSSRCARSSSTRANSR